MNFSSQEQQKHNNSRILFSIAVATAFYFTITELENWF